MNSHKIRLLAESKDNRATINDAATGAKPFWWRGNSIDIEIALAENGRFISASEIGIITVAIKSVTALPSTAPLMLATLGAQDCDESFTASDWEAGQGQLLTVSFTSQQSAIDEGQYVIIVTHADAGLNKNTFLRALISVEEDQHESVAINTPPPEAPDYYTKSELLAIAGDIGREATEEAVAAAELEIANSIESAELLADSRQETHNLTIDNLKWRVEAAEITVTPDQVSISDLELLLPAINAPEFMVRSVLNDQTFGRTEVVCVDLGSGKVWLPYPTELTDPVGMGWGAIKNRLDLVNIVNADAPFVDGNTIDLSVAVDNSLTQWTEKVLKLYPYAQVETRAFCFRQNGQFSKVILEIDEGLVHENEATATNSATFAANTSNTLPKVRADRLVRYGVERLVPATTTEARITFLHFSR